MIGATPASTVLVATAIKRLIQLRTSVGKWSKM